ncbi:MAG: hypothetical protein ACYTAN_18625 [Planctomycetota bacterium]|jgi:YD repeat-containing protein
MARVLDIDLAGRMTGKTTPNNDTIALSYSPTGLLTLKTYPGPATVTYSFDDVGNRTKMEIDGSAYTSADIAYLYDDAYQLTSEVRTGGDAYTQTLCYDASGNRTKKTLGGVDTTYLYNTADQLTSETTGGTTTEYEYDANGALTKSDDGTTENVYTYDHDGYLTVFDTTGTENATLRSSVLPYEAGATRRTPMMPTNGESARWWTAIQPSTSSPVPT